MHGPRYARAERLRENQRESDEFAEAAVTERPTMTATTVLAQMAIIATAMRMKTT